MADMRKNQSAAEATRAGTREAVDRAQDAVQTGVEGVARVTEEFGRAFGLTGQTPSSLA